MRYRKLGRTGFEISDIGYGAWGVGAGVQWKGGSDEESEHSLRRALDLGLNFIDTALAYNEGHSESIIGRVVKSAPHQVFVATKVPPKNRVWPAQPGSRIEDVFPYDYIVGCTETSLRNLDMDTIDLQQLHVWNPEWVGRDEWKRAFEDLKRSGKVRAVGISINDHQPDSALDIVRTGLIDSVQVIYNIFDQSPEANLFPLVEEMNVGVLARVPFDEGALTGSITEESVFDPDEFRAFYFRGDRKREVAERVSGLIEDLGIAREQLADVSLRFCISHPAVSTVIPGMRRVRNVEANCGASDRGPLEEAVKEKLKRHAWNKNYYC